MKTLTFLIITMSSYVFGQNNQVDSIYYRYKPDMDVLSIYDSEIFDLELAKDEFNEKMGQIILEKDITKKKKLIIETMPKAKHSQFIKMSDDELETFRKKYDDIFKYKIAHRAVKVDLKIREANLDEMERSRAKYLIDHGYNLADFNKLSEEQQNEILKSWNYKN